MSTPNISRRTFLGYGAAAAGAVLVPGVGLTEARAQGACATPQGFPADIELGRGAWRNWAREIEVENLSTAVPRTAGDVVRIANWALANGWRVRPRGMMHGWSPLGVPLAASCEDKLLLVDTTKHLTALSMPSPNIVEAAAGATLEDILAFLETHGRGLTSVPAPGDITIGGALAIDAHGAAIPALGETQSPGRSYGSLSNLVLSIQVVAWEERAQRYRLKTFQRDDPQCKAFLTHLGRAFVTAVTLRTGANVNLRCVSRTDIPAAELFATPQAAGERSFAAHLDRTGRAETIWFPFTDNPWLKTWEITPFQPAASRAVSGPYNYVFSDHLPDEVSVIAKKVVTGNGALTPLLGEAQYAASVGGLAGTAANDLWGHAKNLQLYIRPTTLRVTANGYVVITDRVNVQRVLSEFRSKYLQLVDSYRARGMYPANGPVEIRATGTDRPGDVGVPGAEAPALSALTPRRDHPTWDVALWFDVLSFPGTPGMPAFMADLERWFLENFAGFAAVRPEWSKGWAYSDRGAWTDTQVMTKSIPAAYRAGRAPGSDFAWARHTLNRNDPHRVFSNSFLDVLLP